MYEIGVILAFVLYMYQLTMVIYRKNSKLNYNLNKIGYRIGWLGNTKPLAQQTSGFMVLVKVLVWIFGLIFIVFSWVYVLLIGGWLLYQVYNALSAPPEIKKFQWKAKNLDMSFDEILKEYMIVQGVDLAEFEQFKQDYLAELEYQRQ